MLPHDGIFFVWEAHLPGVEDLAEINGEHLGGPPAEMVHPVVVGEHQAGRGEEGGGRKGGVPIQM